MLPHPLPLFLLLATLSFPASAADAPAKPKSRTIEQLIQLTLKEGGDKEFLEDMAVGLGLKGPQPTRMILYGQDQTSDHREHQFHIVYDSAKKKPVGLIWGNTSATTKDDGQFVDGFKYWTTLSGKLVSALHSSGKVGEVKQEKQHIKDKDVRTAFEREKHFFLVDAIPLD